MENTSGIWVPRDFNGMTLYEDPIIGTITHKLRFGDPGLGWDGNAGLGIYIGPYIDWRTGENLGTSWQVWMFGQGEPYMCMRATPGMHLDERVIIKLMETDTRYHNVAQDIKEQNEKRARELRLQWRAEEMQVREDLMRELTRRRRTYYGAKPN
jgi:hypothetical protein